MFERYPPSSVRALFVARNTATSVGSPLIDAGHLLAGSIEAWLEGSSYRPEVFRRLGFTAPSEQPPAINPDIQFSPVVQRLLQDAMAQADRLGHRQIRPQHLLLALLDKPDYPESTILKELGIGRDVLATSAAREALVDDRPLAYGAHLESRVDRPFIRTKRDGAV